MVCGTPRGDPPLFGDVLCVVVLFPVPVGCRILLVFGEEGEARRAGTREPRELGVERREELRVDMVHKNERIDMSVKVISISNEVWLSRFPEAAIFEKNMYPRC